MEKDLQQLAGLPGVHGVFVCDNAGEAVASSTPPVLATIAMSAIGQETARIFSALEAAGHPAARLDIAFDRWRLLVRDFSDGMLLAACGEGLDAAMFRISADIAIAAWRKDGKQQKRLAGGKARRSELLGRKALDDASWQTWTQLKLTA